MIPKLHGSTMLHETSTSQDSREEEAAGRERSSHLWWLPVVGLGGTALAFAVLLYKFLGQVPANRTRSAGHNMSVVSVYLTIISK
ncbi:unnamed protein product [Leptidea sinapis]|uniref:Uncharacterized protein n=1 Tax=Leptidea sinapis TaxID=189913 RepID=A0A5E4QAG3_9NEOP|nr:unnamed protein product [Leptidea sinapis]